MTKFVLNANSVLTIDGNTINCVTSVTFDETLDDYISNCMSNPTKEHVLGLKNVTGTINWEIDDDGDTELGYVAPGVSGALVFDPAGVTAGTIDISSTKLQIMSRAMAFSSTALATGTSNFVCDDLTIAANA